MKHQGQRSDLTLDQVGPKLSNQEIGRASNDKGGDPFWDKAETLLYCALIGYIHYEAPK